MITKYGDKIQFIFCHWDNGATGVINALKAVNQPWANKVMIIGVDGNKAGFDQVQSWPNYISIAQNVETITSKVMEESHALHQEGPVGGQGEHHSLRHHHQGDDRELHRSRVVKA